MLYNLRRPCGKCPFRHDIRPFLTQDRAEDIVESLERGGHFSCHETLEEDAEGEELVETKNSQFCAGALIAMRLSWSDDEVPQGEMYNQMVRIGARLGMYNPDRLDETAPVYDDLSSFVDMQNDGRYHQSKETN